MLQMESKKTVQTFQCGKTSFTTEVCCCSHFPTEAVIKELDMVESMDDLKTSRSIREHQFPNFEMLDAKIASQMEKPISQWIFEYFGVTEAHEAVLDLLIYFALLYMTTMFKMLIPDGMKSCCQSVRYPKTTFWKVCRRCARVSLINSTQCWLCTNEQEINQDRSKPGYQMSKIMVKRHIKQKIRTPKFQVRNERIETQVSVKTQQGKNVS